MPHDNGSEDCTEAARGEDEAEIARAPAQLVLHDVGDEHLPGAPEGEQRHRGREQRSPEPLLGAHEAEALRHLAQHVPVLPRRKRPGGDAEDAEGRDGERARIQQEGSAGPDCGNREPAHGRAGELRREGANDHVDRVRLHEQAPGDDVRHERAEGRGEERFAGSVDGHEREQKGERKLARDRQDSDGSDRRAPHDVREDHDTPAVEAVADDPADEEEEEERQGPGDTHHRERRGSVRELVDLPCNRHEVDAVAEEGNRHPGPEQGEVPDRQGPEHAERKAGSLARAHSVHGPSEGFLKLRARRRHLRRSSAEARASCFLAWNCCSFPSFR